MEPMNIGNSPSSPTPQRANFLPAFLMGENKTPIQSPERVPQHLSFPQTPNQQPSSTQKLFKPFSNASEIHQTSVTNANDSTPSKQGPPKQGLFDTLDIKTSVNSRTFSNKKQIIYDEASNGNVSFASYPNTSVNLGESPFGNADTIYSDINPNVWVTVFGFSSSAISIVLAKLSNCGTIIDKRQPTQGNWIHLKFSSQYEAAKALTLNGKLISNSVMIGVVAYNPHNTHENKENSIVINTAPVSNGYSTPVRARPLRQSITSPRNTPGSLTQQNTPQKSTGMMTKAMEYVFGW